MRSRPPCCRLEALLEAPARADPQPVGSSLSVTRVETVQLALPTQPLTRAMTAGEVAELVKIPRSTVYEWLAGELSYAGWRSRPRVAQSCSVSGARSAPFGQTIVPSSSSSSTSRK